MEAGNIRNSISALHTKFEAFIYMANGMYAKSTIISPNVCGRLFAMGEKGFGTRRMTAVASYFEEIQQMKVSFITFMIAHVPGLKTKRRIVLHVVLVSNRLKLSTLTWSPMFGYKSLNRICLF